MGNIARFQDRLSGWHLPAALALALALGMAQPLAAQEASPGGFTLPAGSQPQQTPPSDVQGPVDTDSSPPRRTDQPAEAPAAPPVATIAPVPVPQAGQNRSPRLRDRAANAQPSRDRQQARDQRPPAAQPVSPDTPVSSPEEPVSDTPAADAPQAQAPVLPPSLPDLPPNAGTPELDTDSPEEGGSIFWWLVAGVAALISLIVMAMRQRAASQQQAAQPEAPAIPTATVPTPPLRQAPPVAAPPPGPAIPAAAPFGTLQGGATGFSSAPPVAPATAPAASLQTIEPEFKPSPAVAPAPAPAPRAAPPAPPKPEPQPAEPPAPVAGNAPRLLLDFNTLGVDVTLVNAVARFHLAVTNMSDIPLSDIALHGAIVQARRGMPPTVDPLQGDRLLPEVQKLASIAPGGTGRYEGQIRLPLVEIEPIEMNGRMLFVPVVHIWIGYTGPDETRYAVTQSFVLGEESNPPGPRVGPLRLDLGPRRFTGVGQRPLQPA